MNTWRILDIQFIIVIIKRVVRLYNSNSMLYYALDADSTCSMPVSAYATRIEGGFNYIFKLTKKRLLRPADVRGAANLLRCIMREHSRINYRSN